MMNMSGNILDLAVKRDSRYSLRVSILEERQKFQLPGRPMVECGICHTWEEKNVHQMAQHEALIPRGWATRFPSSMRHVIFHPCNVVLRHDVCPEVEIVDSAGNVTRHQFVHETGTGGNMAFRQAAIHLCRYEGFWRVRQYLCEIAGITFNVGDDVLRRFDALGLINDEEFMRLYANKNIDEDWEIE